MMSLSGLSVNEVFYYLLYIFHSFKGGQMPLKNLVNKKKPTDQIYLSQIINVYQHLATIKVYMLSVNQVMFEATFQSIISIGAWIL